MSGKWQGGLAGGTAAGASSQTPKEKDLRATRDQAMQLASIVASSKDAIISVGLDAVVQTWNVGATTLFGYTSTEAIGQSVDQLIVPEEFRVERAQIFASASSGGSATLLDTMRRHKDGSLLPVEINASPIFDGAGRVSAISVIFRDLRERKAAELRLRESEARFRLFVEQAPATLAMFDRDMRYLAVSRLWQEEFGFDCQLLGRTYYETFPSIPETWKAVHRRCLAGAAEKSDGDPFVHEDGHVQWFKWEVRPWYDSKDAIGGILIWSEDVTERKSIDNRLRESEQRFQLAIKAARALVYDVDVVSNSTTITYGLEQLTGYQDGSGRLTSEWWHSLIHPDDLAGHLAVLNAQFTKGGQYASEYRLRHANGSWLWLRDDAEIVLGADAKPARIVGTIVDRTERLRAEAALRRSHDTYLNLIQNNPFGVYLVDADFRLAQISAGAQKVFSHIRPLLGRDFTEILRVIWQEPFASEAIARFRHTLETGEPYHSSDTTANRSDIRVVESYDWQIERVTLPDGRSGVVCYFYDMTERKRYEEKIKLLMGEVNHRAKNLLGVVQAVARQTARAGDPNTFVDRLSQRIGALAANQDLLVKSEWRGISVPDLVTAQLAHFKDLIGSRVKLDGPPVRLASAAAQAIGMSLHELATNAGKYGSLSNDSGRLQIEWRVEKGDRPAFVISWQETGGPIVVPPARQGFGQTVIGPMAEAAVEGSVELDYSPSGFRWKLCAPVEHTLERTGGPAIHDN